MITANDLQRPGDPAVFSLCRATEQDADVTLVWDAMVDRAVQCHVSDIHLLCQREAYAVAFRTDGDIRDQGELSHEVGRRLIGHVKSVAGMDIAEHRRPTEGRLKLPAAGRTVDLRISIVPSIHGLDMVVRLLDAEISLLKLPELGMLDEQSDLVHDMLGRPGGLILVTGPTGSGKTTTLYAILQQLVGTHRKIITIEDPVEYDLDGINQTQINPRLGVTYAGLLAAILRQDPDVIMVGEIRDPETAMTAVRAANMGNLVLATTHASRASQAIETILSLGVHPFFLAGALRGVIAQVLVKRLCTHCRQPIPETADMVIERAVHGRLEDGVAQLYHGPGCQHCHDTGYTGRMGLFELFVPEADIKQLIISRCSAVDIETAIADRGWLTLEQTATLAAVGGLTSMEETVRVLPTI